MTIRKAYSTKTRSEMLNFIKSNWSRTITAADIIQHMKDIGTPVNQTTVYRYLDRLCLDHIIIKYPDKSGEKSVYQYMDDTSNCADHLHLKCTKCGKLIHMDCGFMDEFTNHLLKDHNFMIQYKGNMLYGLCKDCSAKEKENENKEQK